MADAQVTYNLEHSACLEECTKCSHAGNCTNQPGMAKSTSKVVVGRKVVTLSKNIQQNLRTHSQYARLTLDPSGKLVKLAISR